MFSSCYFRHVFLVRVRDVCSPSAGAAYGRIDFGQVRRKKRDYGEKHSENATSTIVDPNFGAGKCV